MKVTCNAAFTIVCFLWPMLLVVTPTSNPHIPNRDDLFNHFLLFITLYALALTQLLIFAGIT